MPQETLFTQILDLDVLDVYLDTPTNDESYFSVRGLPEQLGYGKHFFTLTYKDPANQPLLATNSSIVFEFVDSNGTVIFSELADIPDVSGAATGYIWIKEDPLRTAENIFDGELTMYIVGTLEGVPPEWEGRRNLRSSFTFDIRKNTPNLSPIMLYDPDGVVASSSFTETTEEDNKPGYTRGYLNVSASHLQTQGGKIKFAELSYRETGSQANDFTLLNTFELENDTARFEVPRSGSQGLNPISTLFKTPIPREIRRDTPVIFKLRYLDENKTPAQYYDENRLNEQIIITSSVIDVNGSPMIIESEDNLLAGSMFTGNAVGQGFEQSGRNSAFLKTVDYTGFVSASTHVGKSGVMFFSGSVLPGSGDDYKGVGLELVGNSESFLRFRSSPSVLDIRTDKFFVGSDNSQFISASGGIIEISSSKFHLKPDGDVLMAGTIEAADGKIGGFHISESRINSENEKIIFNSAGQISASSLLLASGSFVVDPDNLSRFGQDGFQSFVMVENTGVIMQTSNFNLNTARFIISSSDVGVMAVGSTPPVAHNSGKGFYVDGDGNFLVGNSAGPRIQFDGFDTIISSSNFFLGSGEQFVSGSSGNIEISSSNFHLQPDGNVTMAGTITATAGAIGGFNITSNEISASGLTLKSSGQITGSNFRLEGGVISEDVTILGSAAAESILTPAQIGGVTATKENASSSIDSSGFASFKSASIGGFKVNTEEIRSSNSNLRLKASGQITGSNVLLEGGVISEDVTILGSAAAESILTPALIGGVTATKANASSSIDAGGFASFKSASIAGFTVNTEEIKSSNENLRLKATGQITGSDVKFTGGKIAAFRLTDDALSTDSFFISASATGSDLFISASSFNVSAQGIVTASALSLQGGSVGGLHVAEGTVSVGDILKLKDNGQISGSAVLLGNKSTSNYLEFRGSALTVRGDLAVDSLFLPATIGGATSTVLNASSSLTSDGFAKFTSASIAGFQVSTDEIRSSDSSLRLKSDGQMSGSSILLGDKSGSNFLQFRDNALTVRGDLAVDSLFLPATIGGATSNVTNASSSLTSDGFAKFTSASIAGFTVNTSRIKSADETLQLGSDGTITGSKFLLQGGRITADVTIEGSLSANSISTPAGGPALSEITDAGFARFVSASIAGFTVDTSRIKSSDGSLQLKSDGQITGSKVLLEGGRITSDVTIEGSLAANSISTPAGGSPLAQITDQGFARFVSASIGGYEVSTTQLNSSNDNLIMKNSGQITGSTVLFTGGKIAGFTITGSFLSASNFKLDASDRSISLGSLNNIFKADADDGIQLGNAAFASAPFSVTPAGVLKATSGTIGGWNLGSDRIFSDNINITSAGTIETSDFASGVKGWRISALNNGTAEFENAVIRGTMKTAVFEKETVNAVGGQLYVANSSVLSGSATISASFTTMSVDNVSGFTGSYGDGHGEILSLKKINPTGFTTEYIKVQSASRLDPSSDTNFSGQLFVVRGYSGSLPNGVDSSSLGDIANPPQDYEPGQVLVSTGISGSGYIRLNANPTTNETPYIDIVERTGSAIYDIELMARLGDLSGLSSAKVGTRGGFGLFTERAFLTKDVTVGTLGTEHVTVTSGSIKFLDNETVQAELRGDTWTLGGAHGDTSDTVKIDGDGVTIFGNDASTGVFVTDDSVEIKSDGDNDKLTLNNSGMVVTADGSTVASFGSTVTIGENADDQSRIFIDNNSLDLIVDTGGTDVTYAQFAATTTVGNTSADHVSISSTGLEIKNSGTVVSKFDTGGATLGVTSGAHISASTFDVHISASGDNKSIIDSTGMTITQSGAGVAKFASTTTIGSTGGEHVSISSDGVEIKINPNITVLSASAAGLEMSGSIRASGGTIGGFNIGKAKLKSATAGDNTSTTITVTSNGSNYYIFDGFPGGNQPAITLLEGVTYTFSLGSSLMTAHPMRFGTTAEDNELSNGSNGYFRGSTGIQFTPNSSHPRTLYYFCDLHSGMGNSITIVKPTLFLDGTNGQITGSEVLLSGGVISGSALDIIVPTFFLGDASNFVSGSNGSIKISGSNVSVETPSFFLGNSDQFVSGSNGIVEITSSNFHLSSSGDVVMSGEIKASSGLIGGFEIDADEIKAGSTLVLDSDSNNGEIKLGAASALDTGDGIYMNGSGHFRAGNAIGQGIKFDGTNIILSSSAFNLGNAETFISSSDGNITISGSAISLSTPNFNLGNSETFMSSSNGSITISGSAISLSTPEFYLGSDSQYVSGSDGNIEISSSGYHLKRDGSAKFAAGAIEMTATGDIVSNDFLIERSRLFGAGGDGDFTLSTGTGQSDLTSDDDSSVCFSNYATNNWRMEQDVYAENLTIDNSVTLHTMGFRLFVRGTLDNSQIIQNNGVDGGDGLNGSAQDSDAVDQITGSAGLPGGGGYGGTLRAGISGSIGGFGAANSASNAGGGGGGGAGGTGGIVFIFARNLVGQSSAAINAKGGAGGSGGRGGAGTPTSSTVSGVSALGAGGGGASTKATTRIDVIDPHIVQMMRDVMSTAETAARLGVSAGSGGGGGGCTGTASSGTTSAAGQAGTAGVAAENCIVTSDGKSGGNSGGFVGTSNGRGSGGAGGGGGGGGNGGVIVICTTTAQADDGHSLSVSGGARGSGGNGGTAGGGSGTVGPDGADGVAGAAGKIVYIQV